MILADLDLEKALWEKGHKLVAGIDEVGRGSWAGPLVAAGVIFPQNFTIPAKLADSKQVSKKERKRLAALIRKTAVSINIVEIPVEKINEVGIGKATQLAFRKIVASFNPKPTYCLIDAFHIKYFSKTKQLAIKHGDIKSASIAAASIVAKVYRDDLMEALSQKYPRYGFEKHKGYGTTLHQKTIKKNGFCKIHRTSYNLSFLVS